MKAKANAGPPNPRPCPAPAQTSITATLHRATPYPSTSQRHSEITDAITFYLAKDMCPINTVINEGFRKMVKTLDKKYVIPSRNYFPKVALPALYEKCRGGIEREITAVEYFATTTDLWLHLAVENAMRDPRIDRAVGICKKLVSSFSYSWRRKRQLAQAQKELKLPEHGLKTECPTRWGSRQAMIERVLEQQWAISQVLSSDRKSRHLIPTWQDTDTLEAINKFLQPLTKFTDALSSEKYVSVSFVKPVLHLFSSSILKEKYKDPETQELLDMATALDPRFKLEDRVTPIQARLLSEMAASVSMDTPSTSKRKKTLGSFFKITERASPTQPPHQEQAVASELQSYLQCADLDSEENPLDLWREHQRVYPQLSKLAKKYLSIPATSAPSERVFSTGGNIVTCLRSSLKPENVDRLVFLAKNL
ncbi:E3 SUMO-protein ligase ZBED1 [Labeo rohita]|uniref:E3 SUMO-protein ligase ZBED1 n=1 Tax=Labeo rohita TaxID=84645 RepID=A0ABQ8LYD9_LABRO|nr:E3 SUMO-protein ligase ZBED1 [Labeo rohita]